MAVLHRQTRESDWPRACMLFVHGDHQSVECVSHRPNGEGGCDGELGENYRRDFICDAANPGIAKLRKQRSHGLVDPTPKRRLEQNQKTDANDQRWQNDRDVEQRIDKVSYRQRNFLANEPGSQRRKMASRPMRAST